MGRTWLRRTFRPFGLFLFGVTIVAATAGGVAIAQGTIYVVPNCVGVEDANGNCIRNPTPQQRKDYEDRLNRQREEAARKERERQAKIAEHNRKVDAQLDAWGGNPARRAEAENFVNMQEQAAAARPKPQECKDVTRSYTRSMAGIDEANARSRLGVALGDTRFTCGSNYQVSLSGITCRSGTLPSVELPKPPVGGCLVCISEEHAARIYGWTKSGGYPKSKKDQGQWSCSVTAQCREKSCGPASASAQ